MRHKEAGKIRNERKRSDEGVTVSELLPEELIP
jgi:hypothetical protein